MTAKEWSYQNDGYGFGQVTLDSWQSFHDLLATEMKGKSHCIWRGQRDAAWHLKSSFERIERKKIPSDFEKVAKRHLHRFKKAAIGKINLDTVYFSSSDKRTLENEWWAIGQHYGLATPLLDWSYSPFVALYFAFAKITEPADGFRAVWALYLPSRLRNQGIEVVSPTFCDNARIIAQAGILTRMPLGVSLHDWLKSVVGEETEKIFLFKVCIPSSASQRKDCLSMLNKMNINALTLFPDIYGATQRCNMACELGAKYYPLIEL